MAINPFLPDPNNPLSVAPIRDKTQNDPVMGSPFKPPSDWLDWAIPLGMGAVGGIGGLLGGGGSGAASAATDAASGGFTPAAGGFSSGAASSIPTTGESALASGYGAIAGPSAGDVVGGLTGPSLTSSILGTAKNLAPVLGGAAKSQAAGEQANDLFNLNASKLNTTLPSARLAAAMKANLLQNVTPATINWGGPGSGLKGQIPTVSGGFNLSNLSPQLKQLAQQVIQDELNQELAGPLKPTVGQSTGDNILGGAATAAGIAGGIAPLLPLFGL